MWIWFGRETLCRKNKSITFKNSDFQIEKYVNICNFLEFLEFSMGWQCFWENVANDNINLVMGVKLPRTNCNSFLNCTEYPVQPSMHTGPDGDTDISTNTWGYTKSDLTSNDLHKLVLSHSPATPIMKWMGDAMHAYSLQVQQVWLNKITLWTLTASPAGKTLALQLLKV